MAHFRQYANESQIKNLTNNTYRVFCTTCGVVVFEPAIYSANDSDDIRYICSSGTMNWLIKHGVDKSRLFFASSTGRDRDGNILWGLFPYKVDEPRLVPHRES